MLRAHPAQYTLEEELTGTHWSLDPIDYAKMDAPQTLYHAVQVLHAYRAAHSGAWPTAWDEAACAEIVAATRAKAGPGMDEGAVLALARTASGALAPLTGFLGGLVAQEAIKAVSSKFRPLSQWVRQPPLCCLYVVCVILTLLALRSCS